MHGTRAAILGDFLLSAVNLILRLLQPFALLIRKIEIFVIFITFLFSNLLIFLANNTFATNMAEYVISVFQASIYVLCLSNP
jgi:hypothetical protein